MVEGGGVGARRTHTRGERGYAVGPLANGKAGTGQAGQEWKEGQGNGRWR